MRKHLWVILAAVSMLVLLATSCNILFNSAPDIPHNPYPEDGAGNIPSNITLSWSCSDPDGDTLKYDLYFGTDPNPPLVKKDLTESEYNPGTLDVGTTYYWKVVAKDSKGAVVEGPVWSFTTEISSNKALLKMKLSNIINEVKVNINEYRATINEYMVVYQNITTGGEIEYKYLSSEDVSLELEKGNIYVIGIAWKNPEGWIEVLGFIGNTELGITCVPIGEDATSVIDLGELFESTSGSDVVFNPEVSASEFAKMLGFTEETLRLVGRNDITFKNLLNPDINRNGIIDRDENLRWRIVSFYYFHYEGDNPIFDEFNYIFCIDQDSAVELYGEEFLTGDQGVATLTNLDNGEIITLKQAKKEKDIEYQFWFIADGFPVDGNYKLEVTGKDSHKTYSFYYQNLRFFNPIQEYKAFVFPRYHATIFSDGKVKEVSWEWYMYSGGGLEKPSSEITYLLSDRNNPGGYLYFATKEMFYEYNNQDFILLIPNDILANNGFFEDNSVDVSNEDFWVQPGTFNQGDGRYRMIGELDVSFFFQYDYLEFPSNYDKSKLVKVTNPASLGGIWYNLYYYSQNQNSCWGDFDEFIPAEIDFYSIGEYIMQSCFSLGENVEGWSRENGKFNIDNGKIILYPYDGSASITLEASVADDLLEIDLNGTKVVYSLYRSTGNWQMIDKPSELEGTWIHDNYDALYKKFRVYNMENSDNNNDGFYEGKIQAFSNVEDEDFAFEGTLMINKSDMSDVRVLLDGGIEYKVKIYISEDKSKLMSIGDRGFLIYIRKEE